MKYIKTLIKIRFIKYQNNINVLMAFHDVLHICKSQFQIDILKILLKIILIIFVHVYFFNS